MMLQATLAPLASLPRRFTHWLIHECKLIAPAALFFLAGFAIILLLIKLTLAQYSIKLHVVSNSLLGALIAAKVSLLLDKIEYAEARGYRRIVAVAGKTLLYSLGVIVFGSLERLIAGSTRAVRSS